PPPIPFCCAPRPAAGPAATDSTLRNYAMDSKVLFSHPDDTTAPAVVNDNDVAPLVFSDAPKKQSARHSDRPGQ
ncbi:MAG TPA: hypothetical protein P5061_12915, partial [Mycobacterium sp.]|nr:hypothetical protein [Mycobacterium sp.]